MERFTKRIGDRYVPSEPGLMLDMKYTYAFVGKLAAYENAEKSGELVRVVRCKDCKHRMWDWACTRLQLNIDGFYHVTKDDDFCSYGQRKEE